MFNLKSIAIAFNLTSVDAGAYMDKHGSLLVYRPVLMSTDSSYSYTVASTSFVDGEDLFYSLVKYEDIKLEDTLTVSMENLLIRLEVVRNSFKEYTVGELFDLIYKYEDNYSSNTYDEIRFYFQVRSDIKFEMERLGTNTTTLGMLCGVVDELVYYRKESIS